MFSRAEIAAWGVAVVGIIVMGFIALHGPFGHINVVHAVGGSKVNSNTNPTEVHVRILDDATTIGKYVPATITVRAKESIIFENDSSAAHTVTDRKGAFNSGNLAQSGVFTLSLSKPGTYHYYCLYHPHMLGTIKVTSG